MTDLYPFKPFGEYQSFYPLYVPQFYHNYYPKSFQKYYYEERPVEITKEGPSFLVFKGADKKVSFLKLLIIAIVLYVFFRLITKTKN